MKKLYYIFLTTLLFKTAKAQNAIGLTLGYGHVKTSGWNALLDKYNSSDTVVSKQPYLIHMPTASVFYERKLTEYFYFQGNLNGGYVKSTSQQNGNLKWEIFSAGAGIHINWYIFKMIKGMSKTAWNPILFQAGFSGSYLQKTLTLNGAPVLEPETTGFSPKNIAYFFSGGLGYDLHFGKHFVVQTVFDFKYTPMIDMPEMGYFIHNYEKLGFSTESPAIIIGGRIGVLFLFK